MIHQQTIERLLELCEFIGRNLTFVNHVALMGLEITGFTRANLEKLWIDPFHYKEQLSQSVKILEFYGVKVSIYNHQLCLVNSDVYSNYVSSISDWKAEYVNECEGCVKKGVCGGFFSSSAQHRFSSYITPFS